jgi:transcriptional regulator with XRE-family HTH domain
MALSDRVKVIIRESGMNQKEFARSINVTDSYISKLLRDESGMSNTTARLIEQLYGYSEDWIIRGKGEKRRGALGGKISSPLKKKILMDIEQMNENELKAVHAFIETLQKPYRAEEAG